MLRWRPVAEVWWLIAGLAGGTFAIRYGGAVLGARLPREGPWARFLEALPGTLIVALVTLGIARGGPAEWIAGAVAAGVAIGTRSLPLTMVAGVAAVWLLRRLLEGGA